MAKRERGQGMFFRVTKKERDIIDQKMRLLHISDMGVYLRRMAIYGYMIDIDMQPFNQLSGEVSQIGTNVNQLAKKANATGNIYLEDIESVALDIKEIKEYLREFTRILIDVYSDD
ncbi:MAG: plasmid mobilization relaxosome protein MobC [Eubacteriales bacterium]